MKTRLTLRPGQKGTRRLCEQYGERLVCVRYRYDDERKVRLKTVELVVDEAPWRYCRPWRPIPFDQRVLVAAQYGERDLRRDLRAAGGAWRPEHQAWELPYHVAERLGVHGLILVERASHRNKKGPWRLKRPDASTRRCEGGVAGRYV